MIVHLTTLLFPRVGDKRDRETFVMREFVFLLENVFVIVCVRYSVSETNKNLLLEEFRRDRDANFGFSCPLTRLRRKRRLLWTFLNVIRLKASNSLHRVCNGQRYLCMPFAQFGFSE